MIALVTLTAATTTASFTGGGDAARTKAVVERCPDARHGLMFYRLKYAAWRKLRGEETTVSKRQPKGCAHAKYAASAWRAKARRARLSFGEWWRWIHTLREQRTWHAAVAHVQRPYPGTSGWLLSCSADEGGWGHWVPNSDGGDPGGWLQFMPGTFTRMWEAAREDVIERGYKVERRLASWYSRTGQALAGAWGVTHGRAHEWEGAGC